MQCCARVYTIYEVWRDGAYCVMVRRSNAYGFP